MHRLTIQYDVPTDTKAFEQHYANVHLPLARVIPGLRRLVTSHPTALRGDSPYLVVELWFEDESAYSAALGSPEMAAASADAQLLRTEATMHHGMVGEHEVGTRG